MAITTEEFKARLESVKDSIRAVVQSSMEVGVNSLYNDMSNRIFNENRTITGASFGGYESEYYIALRKSLGRQASEKDLQVYGNLRRSFAANYQKRAIVAIDDILVKSIPTKKTGRVRSAKPSIVMGGQEQQITGIKGKGIFEASNEEANQAVKVISFWFGKQMRELLETGQFTKPSGTI